MAASTPPLILLALVLLAAACQAADVTPFPGILQAGRGVNVLQASIDGQLDCSDDCSNPVRCSVVVVVVVLLCVCAVYFLCVSACLCLCLVVSVLVLCVH